MVTGASGVGKTAAVECLERRDRPGLRCHYLDSIGLPSTDVMDRDFGGPEGWQAWATGWWVERLSSEGTSGVLSVLDAQTRPSFVRDAVARRKSQVPPTRIVLLECSTAARRRRLAERSQAELATGRMEDWAAYLRA